ncbi:MAG: hypothetical protein HYT77_10275 [Deltaproteobacteria bacterium]|nr:hypothetical protein [Deltaproteobacteria bacterium]
MIAANLSWGDEGVRRTDPDPGRIFWGPTALHKETGDSSITNFDLFVWNFDQTFNENLTVGFRTVTPIGIAVGGLTLKPSAHLSDKFHLGIWLEGGFIATLVFTDDNFGAYYLGGGPIFTFGDKERAFNVSFVSYRFGNSRGGDYILMPNIGGSIQVSDRVKLNGELIHFARHDNAGRNWAFLYGIRIFGEKIYGDIGFVMPFTEGGVRFYRVMPLGFPLLSLGFSW